jgi:hypothetical protein
MLKDVAVIHEGVLARCRLIKSDKQLGLILDEHGILPAGQMSLRRRSFYR